MDFAAFKNQMMKTFGLDLNSYKEAQLKRRLENLMYKQNTTSYHTFFELMSQSRQAYETFLDNLTINVSEFFRDPKRWDELEGKILPDLLARKGTLKIWSAACANGCEPYSLAMLLEDLTPGKSHRIEATDLDKKILQAAQLGRYKADAVRGLNKRRLALYFEREKDEYILINKIRQKTNFRQHDLLTDSFGTGYNLILCRNVTIYFTREAQDRLNQKFARAMAPGGILFIGGSEMIFDYQALGLQKLSPCFYQKAAL